MTRKPLQPIARRLQARGVGLVTAIFLLVVLAGLGVAMVTVFSTQQASAAMDELGARAYQAARAGVEWGLYQEFMEADNCPAAPVTFGFPNGGTLSGFTVTVTCTKLDHPTDPDLNRRVIKATACNQPSSSTGCPNPSNNPDYVQRVLEVEV